MVMSRTTIGDYWMPNYPIYCKVCVALAEGRVHKDGLRPVATLIRDTKFLTYRDHKVER